MTETIEFALNGRLMRVAVAPAWPLLDWLRHERRLVGSKEGCHEGDCGACAVLLGSREADGRWHYRSVTGCLLPMAAVAGAHVITIEGLNRDDGALTGVQQAIVDGYGSQCGYCTPGIVVSLTEMLLNATATPTRADLRRALGGHLCRCTGYGGLLRAGDTLIEALDALDLPAEPATLAKAGLLPPSLTDLDSVHVRLPPPPAETQAPAAVRVAGGTDIYTRGSALSEHAPPIDLLRRDSRLHGIELAGDHLRIGAMTTARALMDSDAVRAVVPGIGDYLLPVAAQTIRNRATLGGNLVTGAHNADLATIMLGLDAELEIAAADGRVRELPLRDFYRPDGGLALETREYLVAVRVPRLAAMQVSFERVSKRSHHDKAIVNSCLRVCLRDDRLADVCLAASGVGPRPLRLAAAEAWLTGRAVDHATVAGLLPRLADERIAPVDDYRGSAEYKRLLLRQLVLGHFMTLFGDRIELDALAAGVSP